MKGHEMFYAAMNNCVIGHDFHMVAFESKKERNEFQRYHSAYRTISPRDAAKLPQFEKCKLYPHTVFNESRRMTGFVFFKNNGEFHSIR